MTNSQPAEPDSTERILREWAEALLADLDLAGTPVDIDQILGLAGTAAHAVIRPAAPLTTFLVGFAAGRAAESGRRGVSDAVADAIEIARGAATRIKAE